MALDQLVSTAGPQTAAQLAAEINEEFAELYKRSFALVDSPAGTNAYTGSVTPARTLATGNGFLMKVPNANTGPSTYNGVDLLTSEGAALQAGQLAADQWIAFVYDAVAGEHRIVSPLAAGATPIVRVYTSSTSWPRPSGLRYIKVRNQAPGGGGGGAGSATNAAGGGGGSGGYGEAVIPAASLGATETVTIGAVGKGGSSGAGTGGTGGATSFGALVVTAGGLGGVGGSSATGGVSGGAGGAAGTGGDINLPGTPGAPGIGGGASGTGAQSPLGGPGAIGVTAGTGIAAGNYGGGGSGGYHNGTNRGGGAGGPGVIIVEEYY
jgi:hypothetical protein